MLKKEKRGRQLKFELGQYWTDKNNNVNSILLKEIETTEQHFMKGLRCCIKQLNVSVTVGSY